MPTNSATCSNRTTCYDTIKNIKGPDFKVWEDIVHETAVSSLAFKKVRNAK